MVLKDLRDGVISLINQSGLPVDAVYYIMRDLMGEIESIYNQEIAAEAAQKQAQEKKEESENQEEPAKKVEVIDVEEEN